MVMLIVCVAIQAKRDADARIAYFAKILYRPSYKKGLEEKIKQHEAQVNDERSIKMWKKFNEGANGDRN